MHRLDGRNCKEKSEEQMSKSGEETCGLQFPTVSQVIAKWQLLVHGACRMCPLHLAESPGMMLDITYSFFFCCRES